jgi:PleD family two-component response regulator
MDGMPQVLKCADEALYAARQNGRNRVIVARRTRRIKSNSA